MSRPTHDPKPSNSVQDAMPFAKQAWAVSTEGERGAIRLGLIPLRLATNFGKWSTPGAFRKALMEVAAKARGITPAEPGQNDSQ
ncbi:MAG TPA: hypothetical protein VNG35_15535 [Gemmatimonadales bacterium]|nr:hypothetical protein [Gemmatimonadales bacterium]